MAHVTKSVTHPSPTATRKQLEPLLKEYGLDKPEPRPEI